MGTLGPHCWRRDCQSRRNVPPLTPNLTTPEWDCYPKSHQSRMKHHTEPHPLKNKIVPPNTTHHSLDCFLCDLNPTWSETVILNPTHPSLYFNAHPLQPWMVTLNMTHPS